MKVHILGICGTFMGGVAALARELGVNVSGSDRQVYPPMSTQLNALGVQLCEGYLPEHLAGPPDLVVIGNALSRGNLAVEHVLNAGLDYCSGPEWLAREVLRSRTVLAVAGTHGKTTTTCLLAWLLETAGLQPGFLIGGAPGNFPHSARLGAGQTFVIEADEYDSAFFDKRSKFLHYRPNIVVLNNLEFDHADIFPDLAAIQRQFHFLLRSVPANGTVIVNADDKHLAAVLTAGCWSRVIEFSLERRDVTWFAELTQRDGTHFQVFFKGEPVGIVQWALLGQHNVANALAALAAAHAQGVDIAQLIAALPHFIPPRRRLELLGNVAGVTVYDDFAHHPSAIRSTLDGLRAHVGGHTLHAVLEPRSNTMRMGKLAADLSPALSGADHIWLLKRPELVWDAEQILAPLGERLTVLGDSSALLDGLDKSVKSGDSVVFMSNGGFDALPKRFVELLRDREQAK